MCSVESVMGGPSLGSKRLPLKQTQTEKGVNNANSRRSRAFRAGLVRAVALLHDSFLQQLRQNSASEPAATPEDRDETAEKVRLTETAEIHQVEPCPLILISLPDNSN